MFFVLTGLVLGIPLIGLPLAALADQLRRQKEPKVGRLLAILLTGPFGAVAYFYWQARVRGAPGEPCQASPGVRWRIVIKAYPFVLIAGVFAVCAFVVPQFVQLLEELARPLPLVTRHLVAFSEWTLKWAVLIAPLVLVSGVSHFLLYYILATRWHGTLASIYRLTMAGLVILLFSLSLLGAHMGLIGMMRDVGQG